MCTTAGYELPAGTDVCGEDVTCEGEEEGYSCVGRRITVRDPVCLVNWTNAATITPGYCNTIVRQHIVGGGHRVLCARIVMRAYVPVLTPTGDPFQALSRTPSSSSSNASELVLQRPRHVAAAVE